jgi:hypothetical protein
MLLAQDVPTERFTCLLFFYPQDVPTGHKYKNCNTHSVEFMSRRDILWVAPNDFCFNVP